MNNIRKVIVLDLDETLIHSYHTDKVDLMILRPGIDKLVNKLQEVKKHYIDIILCTTSRNEWVNKFFELKPAFENVFDKIYTRDNENEWRYFSKEHYPLEYNARCKNVNLEYLKPVTTFGYDQVLYIDDNKLEDIRLKILYELTDNKLNKDITSFTGFKFYRKSIVWAIIQDFNTGIIKNDELNKKLKEYLKLEESNPGCDIMVSVINDFVNKQFKPGLSMLDKLYYNEYNLYKEKILQLEKDVEQIVKQEETK